MLIIWASAFGCTISQVHTMDLIVLFILHIVINVSYGFVLYRIQILIICKLCGRTICTINHHSMQLHTTPVLMWFLLFAGREFVRQYYTLLNQAPLHLHRYFENVLEPASHKNLIWDTKNDNFKMYFLSVTEKGVYWWDYWFNTSCSLCGWTEFQFTPTQIIELMIALSPCA